ncbi:hypothetical protein HW44_11405 [Nitrosococcus oceani]|nr:hypothetical protein HW44_11405 [Nitrosococcus oceani]
MFTSKGVLEPRRLVLVVWGVIQVLVVGVLLLSGGLEALQTISIIAAFLFMILMVFMAVSLLRSLQNERRKIERQNLALRVAVEKLLASEAAGRITSDGCRDKETDIESKRSEE